MDEFVAAGNLNEGDIIRIAGERGEFRVRKTKGVEVECFGPLGAGIDANGRAYRGTGGTKLMPKMRTFVEERVTRLVRTAAEDEERKR